MNMSLVSCFFDSRCRNCLKVNLKPATHEPTLSTISSVSRADNDYCRQYPCVMRSDNVGQQTKSYPSEILPWTPHNLRLTAPGWESLKIRVWRRAIHALVQHERLFFRRYVSPSIKHVIVDRNNLVRLLFLIVANDNVQWRDNDVKMNILCCRLSACVGPPCRQNADWHWSFGSCVAGLTDVDIESGSQPICPQ